MANITNSSPVVTEDKLKDFYEDIKPFLGCPAYVTQEGDAEYYSTDEKVIGRWIDGKPIYQKTWTGLNYTIGTSWVSLSAIVSNGYCDRVLNGFGSRADGSLIPLVVYVPNGDVQVVAAQSSFGEVTEISLTYTKTTDSAVTTTEQKPTHYSTDEQVVGTWIDGRPVYQRTYTSNTSFNRKTNVVIDIIANVGDVANCFGYVINTVDNNRLFIGYAGGVNLSMLTTGELRIYSEDWNCNGYRVTIQYTKTTD